MSFNTGVIHLSCMTPVFWISSHKLNIDKP